MEEMKFDKYISAQEICDAIYRVTTSDMIAGMSLRIHGGDYQELSEYSNRSSLYPYFNKADQMIKEGRIFYIYPFKCNYTGCPGRFRYGGGWACNTCNTCINDPEWWKIKVMQDGNAWICIGDGFVNLQESKNYAFGNTRQEAIDNYAQLFNTKATS